MLITFQFVWQARQAQIDGVLCFLTTLTYSAKWLELKVTGKRAW